MPSIFSLIDPAIFLLTARDGDRESGMIATWICDATLIDEKPRIMAVLSPEGFTVELIRKSGRFVVHLLAKGQEQMIQHFGLQSGRDHEKLQDQELTRTESGIALIKGVAGYAECVVAEEIPAAERIIFICAADRQETHEKIEPLTLHHAYASLPKDVVRACEAQRRRDGERDRRLI